MDYLKTNTMMVFMDPTKLIFKSLAEIVYLYFSISNDIFMGFLFFSMYFTANINMFNIHFS